MRARHFVVGGLLLVGVFITARSRAQDPQDEIRINTMRPVIRGRTQAAASMKPEATRAAEDHDGQRRRARGREAHRLVLAAQPPQQADGRRMEPVGERAVDGR